MNRERVTRKSRKPATKASRARRAPKAKRTLGGVPVTAVDFFGSLSGGRTINTYCPFCDAMVKASQKGYLMACKVCGRRID